MKEHGFYSRKWLNREGHYGTAFILAKVGKKGNSGIDATVTLSDCYRQIDLSFDVCDREDLENSRFKLDNIIETLTLFRDEFERQAKGLKLP